MGAFTKLAYHIVFGTKYRQPIIRREFRDRLYEYVGGTIRGLKGHLLFVAFVTFCSQSEFEQKKTKVTKVRQKADFLSNQVLLRNAVNPQAGGLANSGSCD